MNKRRIKCDDQNLTALRALPLLVQTTRAIGKNEHGDLRIAVLACQEALEKHVRFSVRRSKAR